MASDDPNPGARLANWRDPRVSRWAFRHVPDLIPTAAVAAGAARPFEHAPRDITDIRFTAVDGSEQTVARLIDDTRTNGLIVLQHGRVVAEHYAGGLDAETPHILFSITKSVVGSLTGILVDRGSVDVAAPVTSYVPEMAGSAYADAAVRHLLDMTVGIEFNEDYLEQDPTFRRYRTASGWAPGDGTIDGLHDFLPSLKPGGAHGARFHYVSPNTELLGWVLERAAGRDLADLLSDEIWKPIGAEHKACITVDPQGTARAAGGLCATLRDLARFGHMQLHRGRVGGIQIVPARWIDDTWTGGDPAAWQAGDFADMFPHWAYRNQWYQLGSPVDPLAAFGVFGQSLYLDPAADAVIAKLAADETAVNETHTANELRAFAAITDFLTTD